MLSCRPGVVNLLFSQATGFSNALKTSTSSNRYWDCAGAIAIVGIAAGVYILTQYVRHVWLMVRNVASHDGLLRAGRLWLRL